MSHEPPPFETLGAYHLQHVDCQALQAVDELIALIGEYSTAPNPVQEELLQKLNHAFSLKKQQLQQMGLSLAIPYSSLSSAQSLMSQISGAQS